jgi:predicted ester cyclase
MTWARIKAHGTHQGSMMGLPPTGTAISIDVIDVCRFADGKIAEHWGVADRLGMMQQIGAIRSSQSLHKR